MIILMMTNIINILDNTHRAGLAPARSVYSTLLRNAAVRWLLGALKICPGLPSS